MERLSTIKQGATLIQSNQYDFAGRRISKSDTSTTTYYFYTQNGLEAEFNPTGEFIQGYGYQPSSTYTTNPLYKIDKNGETLTYNYYQNDHLYTPQKLIDKRGNVNWQAEYQAFGEVQVLTETVENNLRFPGQYYDKESGLYQNYFREYDGQEARMPWRQEAENG